MSPLFSRFFLAWLIYYILSEADASEAAASRPKREKKEAFRIDFLTADEEDIRTRKKTLFAPVVRGAGINLSGPSGVKKGRGRKGRNKDKDEKRNDQTLPDDMHFSERQLVTLFLKPKFSVRKYYLELSILTHAALPDQDARSAPLCRWRCWRWRRWVILGAEQPGC